MTRPGSVSICATDKKETDRKGSLLDFVRVFIETHVPQHHH
jgi:hypothetical protein